MRLLTAIVLLAAACGGSQHNAPPSEPSPTIPVAPPSIAPSVVAPSTGERAEHDPDDGGTGTRQKGDDGKMGAPGETCSDGTSSCFGMIGLLGVTDAGSTWPPPAAAVDAGTRPSPKLRELPPLVVGGLPKEIVQRIARQNFGRFRLCYERGLLANPKLQGEVRITFVIDAHGAPTRLAADPSSTLPDNAVVQCILGAFSTLAFPEPGNAATVSVKYGLALSPG